jgi:non-specific serine/threonine protein kinase
MGFAFLERFSLCVTLVGSDVSTPTAVSLLEEARDRCAAAGEQWQQSWALRILAIACWRQNESLKALELLDESTKSAQMFSDALGMAWNCAVAAWALVESDAETATRLIGASEALWQPLGTHLLGVPHLVEWHEHCRQRARDQLGVRRFGAAYRAGAELDYSDAGSLILDHGMAGSTPTRPVGIVLTRREKEVAERISEGKSNREIAASLVVSQRTAETHVENILRKLGFTTRTQIAVWVNDQRV